MLLLLPMLGWGQAVTQSNFTAVLAPQYMGSGTATRLPVMFRATVTGLAVSTVYRYFVQGVTNSTTGGGTVDFGGTSSGAGNSLLINSAGTTYTYTSSPTLNTVGTTCETFTTDAAGSYTGWFGFVNTGNARFTGGNVVYPCIVLGTTSTVLKRYVLDQSITVLAYSASAGASNGTFFQGASAATAKNLVAVYGNTTGTGRPLTLAVLESIGGAIGSVPTGYSTAAGAWNTIIPNTLSAGVQRIEQRSVTTGAVVCANTATGGVWPSTTTVNPTGGTTALALTLTDAPLASLTVTTTISPTTGSVGTSVSIAGTNFVSGGTTVSFNGTTATTTVNAAGTSLTATVPAGATTGPVTLTTSSSCSSALAAGTYTVPAVAATTVSTGTVAGPVCVGTSGASLSVPFSTTGSFNGGNVFSVELSTAAGAFPGTVLTTMGTASPLTAAVPATTASGTAYRVRVNASDPATTGLDNGTNLVLVNYQTNEVTSAVATAGNAQVTLTWATPASCFSQVLIIAKAAATFSASPSTSATYADGGNTFGSGTEVPATSAQYVVYQGSGTSATITGLANNTQYAFRIYTTGGNGYSTSVIRTATPIAPATLTEVLLPQYIEGYSGTLNTNRLPYAFRATLNGLTPGTTYRYYNTAVLASDLATSGGAGNPTYVTTAGNFVRTSSPGLSTAGSYGSLTTDGSGSFTGWFILESTAGTRFADGSQVLMRIVLNDGANGTSEVTRLTTTNSIGVRALGSTGAQATGLYGQSMALASNFVMLYDNASGSPATRPLAGTVVESDGAANTATNSYAGFYSANVEGVTGAWGTLIPNDNANGVRLIEQRDLAMGTVVGCVATSSAGTWPSGTVTAAPAGLALALTSLDAPLSCTVYVGFNPAARSVAEGNTTNTITLNVTVPNAPTGSLTVTVSDSGTGTATAGNDYTFSPQALTFTAAGTQTVTVTILGDTTPEANETVLLNLTTSGAPATVLNSGTLTIADDDTPIAAGLILNEFSQGTTGVKEYFEFLVTGTPGSVVDLRGWVFDDNNGEFSNSSTTTVGVATGHIRFANNCTWERVPVGAIIVCYNAGDRNLKFSGTAVSAAGQIQDDPTDANLDYIYVVPVLASVNTDQTYFSGSNTLPSSSSSLYDDPSTGPNWTNVNESNSGDAVQLRRPAAAGQQPAYFQGLSYGTGSGTQTAANSVSLLNHPEYATLGADALYFANSGANANYYFDNTNSNNFRLRSNWKSTGTNAPDGSLNETPGAANSSANAAYITSLRQNFAITAAAQSYTCNLRPNETRVYVDADPRLILRLQNNSSNDLGATTAATLLRGSGAARNTNQPGKPFYLSKQYQVTPTTTAAGDNYTITFYVTAAELSAFAASVSAALPAGTAAAATSLPARLKIYKVSGTTLLSDMPDGVGRDSAVTTVTSNGYGTGITTYSATFTSFSSYAIGAPTSRSGVLPVELTAFTTERRGSSVSVRWATASEKNSASFEVQRSLTGFEFATVARVAAHGITSQAVTYAISDNTAPASQLYYRLRQTDTDGTVTYSSVAIVASLLTNVVLYPNPARTSISFLAPPATPYRVLNQLGQTLLQGTTETGASTTTVTLGKLSPGLYVLELQTVTGRVMRKFEKE